MLNMQCSYIWRSCAELRQNLGSASWGEVQDGGHAAVVNGVDFETDLLSRLRCEKVRKLDRLKDKVLLQPLSLGRKG